MFFHLSKIIWFLIRPSNFLILILVLGWGMMAASRRLRKTGIILSGLAITALLLAGFSPVANVLLATLENRFPARSIADLPSDIDGIILLGGFEDFGSGTVHIGLPINEAAERLTETVRLARHFPQARVVFTGALVNGLDTTASLANPIARFMVDMGLDQNRIILEPKARNTYENAVLTKDLIDPQPGQNWLLVTSGFHMPRSVGVFRQVGFEIIPYPVDLRTNSERAATSFFIGLSDGLKRTDMVMRGSGSLPTRSPTGHPAFSQGLNER
ncbi:MAG: YdcF family protein [Pseudomonadota bacterium]